MVVTQPPDRLQRLPIPLTSFVGREQEVIAACALLRREDVRLLTLTGAGGVGKTRLALQVAATLADDVAEHIWFVDLSAITDPHLLIPTIAQTLGVREAPDQPLIELLHAFLRDRTALLLLDNVERIATAAAPIADLLPTCSRLKLLVTSRMPLRVSAEREYPVPPLTLPDRERASAADDLLTYEAIQLYVERAGAVKPDFTLIGRNAFAIGEICRRLDGLPLAIELAAARSKVLSPRAMLARLERRLPLLTGGPRDVPARLQTMRDAIAWSYDLLDEQEQTLFRRLSVFSGGFTLDAAEAIGRSEERGTRSEDTPPFPSLLDLVASLVDHSLLRQVEQPNGEPRFLMLETVREFGLERIEICGEAPLARQRHARWCLALVESALPKHREQWQHFDHLETEYDNLRTALGWAMAAEPELCLRLAKGLQGFWNVRGPAAEGMVWLERALARAVDAPNALRAEALMEASVLAKRQRDARRMEALAAASLDLWRREGSAAGAAHALFIRGSGLRMLGDVEQATVVLTEAVESLRRVGKMVPAGWALANLGLLAQMEGDLARGAALFEEVLTIMRQSGGDDDVAWCFSMLAGVAQDQGDAVRVAAYVGECLRVWRVAADKGGVADCLPRLAFVAATMGQWTRAAHFLGATVRLREVTGVPVSVTDRAPYERTVCTVQAALGKTAFDEACAAGRSLPDETVIADALALVAEATALASSGRRNGSGLTRRELDVLRLIVAGHTDREIADALFVSPRTVMTHVQHLFAKLGVNNRQAAAASAVKQNLV